MAAYWCYKYSLNEDVTVISFREFHDRKDDIRPTISMCLQNPFVSEKLVAHGINESSYLDFLKGNYFTKEMLAVDFNQVTINLHNYIKGYRIYYRNETHEGFDSGLTTEEKKALVYSSFIGFDANLRFYKCFALNIPKIKQLMIFRILVSNNIFPKGERPTYFGLQTFVHLPHQFLLSTENNKWIWKYRTKNESYKMRSLVRGINIETKRNKKDDTCNELWQEYDDWLIKRHKNETGCNNPYQKQDDSLPMCDTQKLMIHGLFSFFIKERYTYERPCKSMKDVRIEYLESNMKTAEDRNVGEFWFSIKFVDRHLKDIQQTR